MLERLENVHVLFVNSTMAIPNQRFSQEMDDRGIGVTLQRSALLDLKN